MYTVAAGNICPLPQYFISFCVIFLRFIESCELEFRVDVHVWICEPFNIKSDRGQSIIFEPVKEQIGIYVYPRKQDTQQWKIFVRESEIGESMFISLLFSILSVFRNFLFVFLLLKHRLFETLPADIGLLLKGQRGRG